MFGALSCFCRRGKRRDSLDGEMERFGEDKARGFLQQEKGFEERPVEAPLATVTKPSQATRWSPSMTCFPATVDLMASSASIMLYAKEAKTHRLKQVPGQHLRVSAFLKLASPGLGPEWKLGCAGFVKV